MRTFRKPKCDNYEPNDCRRCLTTGYISVPKGCFGSQEVECPECHGEGQFSPDEMALKRAEVDLKNDSEALKTKPIQNGEIVRLMRQMEGSYGKGFVQTDEEYEVSVMSEVDKPSNADEVFMLVLKKVKKEASKPAVLCDGCNVRGGWEHKCHGHNVVVRGERTMLKCECPEEDCIEQQR